MQHKWFKISEKTKIKNILIRKRLNVSLTAHFSILYNLEPNSFHEYSYLNAFLVVLQTVYIWYMFCFDSTFLNVFPDVQFFYTQLFHNFLLYCYIDIENDELSSPNTFESVDSFWRILNFVETEEFLNASSFFKHRAKTNEKIVRENWVFVRLYTWFLL